MENRRDTEVQLIPLDEIIVVNPRQRTQRKFKQIVDSIAHIGLKKPITVTPNPTTADTGKYLLVCGQGRLEAFEQLGQTEIPAMVVHVSENQLLLMSLVENLARRTPKGIELLREIGVLKERGYDFAEIARKTDLGESYIRGILRLLEQGEERLLTAVEAGIIPISIAVTIATSDDQTVQRALVEAYQENNLRGRRLIRARRIIEQRREVGKKSQRGGATSNSPNVSAKKLLRAYREETNRQRALIEKAKICEARLLFAVTAMRQLLQEEPFAQLLQEEQLDTLPAYLAEAIEIQGEQR